MNDFAVKAKDPSDPLADIDSRLLLKMRICDIAALYTGDEVMDMPVNRGLDATLAQSDTKNLMASLVDFWREEYLKRIKSIEDALNDNNPKRVRKLTKAAKYALNCLRRGGISQDSIEKLRELLKKTLDGKETTGS